MKKPIPTVCEACNGESAENLVGQPEMCSACHDTGKYCPECDQCGDRSEYESWAFSDQCMSCFRSDHRTMSGERGPW